MTRRRDLIKLGLLSTGSTLYHANVLNGDDFKIPKSPPTTPFVQPLPMPLTLAPSVLNPVPTVYANQQQGEAPRADHQGFASYYPQVFYDLHVAETMHAFYPGWSSPVWTYGGTTPGPNIRAYYGQPVLVRFHNDLPANHIGFGIPQITTHLHNAHSASESDGFPGDFFNTGLFKDNHYANIFAGGDPTEALGTLWYHDHRLDFTTQNVYKGLAGFYILHDTLDSGNEMDSNPSALHLPSGQFDVTLAIGDKTFDATGALTLDPFNLDGYIGDKFTVNGAIQPFFQVARRKYRFRLLDMGPSRFYQFFLSSGQSFVQIASDGNLLPHPVTRPSILLAPAERIDVIVDFTNYKIGDQIHLQNRLIQRDGTGPSGGLVSPGDLILRFDVVLPDVPDPSMVPANLRPLPVINPSKATTTRRWVFKNEDDAWEINGKVFDLTRTDANPKQKTGEIWVFQNDGGEWSHPIHVHFEEFRILSRNGRPPDLWEAGRKDVVRLGPDDQVQVYLQFRDFVGQYPIHCHNTIHEDHAMMARWVISA
jgi:FtsP/CotA-like multicopper oxidase with cupredoxin domain